MLGKILIYCIIALLSLCILSPAFFAYVYFLSRPLLQPFAFQGMQVFGVPLTGLMAMQLTVFTILWGSLRKDFTFRVPNSTPLYLLVVFSLLSMANSVDLYASVSGFAKILAAVMSYVLVYNAVKSDQDARRLLLVLTIATIVPMAVGYYQFFTGTGGRALGGATNRVMGTLGLANAYGIFLALSLCAAMMLLMSPRWRVNKLFVIVIVGSMLVSSIIALNRGTWIALGVAIVMSTVLYLRKVKIVYLVLAGVVLAGVFSNMIVNRFEQLEERTHYMPHNTFERRVAYWGVTLEQVPEHLVIGWGIGTAKQVMEGRFDVADVTHNDYLRMLLEVGVLGLAAYVWFLARIGIETLGRWRRREQWQMNYPLMIAIGYFLIISLPQNIYDHMVNLPLFLALIALSYRLSEFAAESETEARHDAGPAPVRPWSVVLAKRRGNKAVQ